MLFVVVVTILHPPNPNPKLLSDFFISHPPESIAVLYYNNPYNSITVFSESILGKDIHFFLPAKVNIPVR